MSNKRYDAQAREGADGQTLENDGDALGEWRERARKNEEMKKENDTRPIAFAANFSSLRETFKFERGRVPVANWTRPCCGRMRMGFALAYHLAAVFGRILKGRQDDGRRIGHRAH